MKKWSLLILVVLAVSGVIGWKEKRCQSQAYQCRAEYSAQLSPRLPADQRAAGQQTIAAACEPNGYFCRLFGAANLPNVGLLLAGIAGIVVAIYTLKGIEKQTEAMGKSVTISEKQTRILKKTTV